MNGKLLIVCLPIVSICAILAACKPADIPSSEAAANWPTSQAAAHREGLHSMKGWEVYVWIDGERTLFSLLLGTNRNKTATEIFDPAPAAESNDHFILACAAPFDDIRAQLARLADSEWVSFIGVRRLEADAFETIPLSEETLQLLHNYANELNLQTN